MNEITINGETYNIDIERAKELGLVSRKKKLIESFDEGDLFAGKYLSVVVVRRRHDSSLWDIMGLEYWGLSHFSDLAHSDGLTFDKMLDFLNNRELKFIKNLNDDIRNLVNVVLEGEDFED